MIETRIPTRSSVNHKRILPTMFNRSMHPLASVRCFLIVWMMAGLSPELLATIEELPMLVYGKVVKVGEGGTYQLFRGTLRFEVINTDDPDHVINFEH